MSTKTVTKTKTFGVSYKLNLDVNINIEAASLEGALEKARALSVPDVITNIDDYADYQPAVVTGLYEQ